MPNFRDEFINWLHSKIFFVMKTTRDYKHFAYASARSSNRKKTIIIDISIETTNVIITTWF